MSSAADEYAKGNLVVYREKIAIVTAPGSKIAIRLANGTTVNVRPKDIELLHEGPVSDFSQLQPREKVDFNELRELLEGETTTLGDLAELAYGENTPAAAQAIYALIQDGLYCTGSIAGIHVNTLKEYESELNRRNKKVAEQQAWDSFIERVRQKRIHESDHDRLHNLEDVAYGKSRSSRILKELNSETTPENAHQLLLNLGYWDFRSNPYIRRFGFSTNVTCPEVPIDIPEQERLDLTHLKAFAIDDEGNTDPDDAVSYDNGKLWIHVADVAAVVHPDSPLDIHARSQAATLYLPGETVTMLPEKITEVFGLGLSETSSALSFGLTLKENGEIDTIEIRPTIIRVTRITYEQAEKMLDQSPVREINDLCLKYHNYRAGNGAIQLNFPEVKIQVKNDFPCLFYSIFHLF